LNILVTGGLGYIGSHAAVKFTGAGHKVIVVDNLSNSKIEVHKKIQLITNNKIVFIKGDVLNKSLINNIFKNYHIDVVAHFAGFKSISESIENPIKYYLNNISGTFSIFNQMKKFGVKIFVFSSSATVYGYPKSLPIEETHETSPINPYARSKLFIEKFLKDMALSNNELRIISLRYFNPVGAHLSGLIGENPNGMPNNLMPFLSRVAIGKYPFLKIYGCDYKTVDGTGVRDYIHVDDLAEGHLSAINFLLKNTGFHIINLGTGKGHSVLELLNEYELVSGKKIPYKFYERRDGDVDSSFASVKLARKKLKWKSIYSINDICKSEWNWIKSEYEN